MAGAPRDNARCGADQSIGQPVDRHRQQQDKQQLYNADQSIGPHGPSAGADVGSVPISDEMEEPCDSQRDRRSEYDQNPPWKGSKIGNAMTCAEPATS